MTPGNASVFAEWESCSEPYYYILDSYEADPYELPQPWIKMRWHTNYVDYGGDGETYFKEEVTSLDNRDVNTRPELHTGGSVAGGQQVGGQSLWMITVSATAQHLGGLPVPPSQITVLGQTPNALGQVFILLLDHTTQDVTPTFSGAQPNANYIYAFSVDAQRVRLRLYDGYNWDATHHKQTNWIGENVDLTATLEGKEAFEAAGVTVVLTNVAWSAPTTKAFSNYYHDPKGIFHPTFPLDQPAINFYWLDAIDPATVSATAQVIVNGTTFAIGPAPTYYRVNRPDPVFHAQNTGPLQIDFDSYALRFGENNTSHAGVYFLAEYDDIGEWDVVQLVLSTVIHENATLSGCSYITGSGVDGKFPYFSREKWNTFLEAWDSPYQQLPLLGSSMDRTDLFYMWLMFRPVDGSWVPVKRIPWFWSGRAIYTPPWVIDAGFPPLFHIGSAVSTTVFPTWTNAVQNSLVTNSVPCPP